MMKNPLLISLIPKIGDIFIKAKLKEYDYINLRPCKFCGLFAKTLCGRCGTCYCSKSCQYHHWQQHKLVCLTLPELHHHPLLYTYHEMYRGTELPVLVAAPDRLVEVSWQNICLDHQRFLERTSLVKLPENGTEVIITGFASPNRLFIRECSPAKQAEYAHVVQQINILGAQQQRMMRFPERFDYALHNWEGHLKRVQILEILHDTYVRVHLIDEGRDTICRLVELLEMSEEIRVLPPCASPIQLHGVENYMMGERILKFMPKFLNQRCTIQLPGMQRSLTRAVLMNDWTGKVINEEIREFCYGGLILNTCVDDLQDLIKFKHLGRAVTSHDLQELFPTQADAVKPTDWNTDEEADPYLMLAFEELDLIDLSEDEESLNETDV